MQLTHGVHGDNEGHIYSRPITLSKQLYIANAQCDFSFETVSNCVTFLKIRMHIGDRIRYFCNRKISAIQTKLNSWLRHETRSFLWGISHARTQRGGGGNRWPQLTLKITSSIGNKQLTSTPTPGKCWTPIGTKNCNFSELMEYNKGMSNMLGVSIYWTVEDFWNKTTSTCGKLVSAIR